MVNVLKYGMIISSTLFLGIAILIVERTKKFSYSDLTISKSIHFLTPKQEMLFRFNFVLKAGIDLLFAWYVIDLWRLSITSPIALLLICSSILFGVNAYFTEEKGRVLHAFVIYSWVTMILYAEYMLSQHTYNTDLIQKTNIIVAVQAFLAFGSLILNKTNSVIQFSCAALLYIWMFSFLSYI